MMHTRPLAPPLPEHHWAPIAEHEIQGSEDAVRAALRKIKADLHKARLSSSDIEHAQIVLGEVLNNIVEHALSGQQDGGMRLAAFRSKTSLRVVILDNGARMPNGKLPMRPQPRIDVPTADLPEGGFGWHLIRALTDELVYERRSHGNMLTLHIPITAHPLSNTASMSA